MACSRRSTIDVALAAHMLQLLEHPASPASSRGTPTRRARRSRGSTCASSGCRTTARCWRTQRASARPASAPEPGSEVDEPRTSRRAWTPARSPGVDVRRPASRGTASRRRARARHGTGASLEALLDDPALECVRDALEHDGDWRDAHRALARTSRSRRSGSRCAASKHAALAAEDS